MSERLLTVQDYVRLRQLGRLGAAFIAEVEVVAQMARTTPGRKAVSEWDSLYRAWLTRPRG